MTVGTIAALRGALSYFVCFEIVNNLCHMFSLCLFIITDVIIIEMRNEGDGSVFKELI